MYPIRIYRLSLLLFSLSSFISLCSASAVKKQSAAPDSVIVFPLPDDPDTSLGYYDIQCTDAYGNIVKGDDCYYNIQSALVALLDNLENTFGAYNEDNNAHEGYLYGFDNTEQVVASIFYKIPEGGLNYGWVDYISNDNAEDGTTNANIADDIIAGLRYNNIIEGCIEFIYDFNSFDTGTVLILVGWWEKAYYIQDISTAEDYLSRCISET